MIGWMDGCMDDEYTFARLPGCKARFAFSSLGETRCSWWRSISTSFSRTAEGNLNSHSPLSPTSAKNKAEAAWTNEILTKYVTGLMHLSLRGRGTHLNVGDVPQASE